MESSEWRIDSHTKARRHKELTLNLNRPNNQTLRAFVPSCEPKPVLSRRDFLWELGGGLGGVALAAMMNEAQAATNPLAPKAGHHGAKAKAVIQIFCPGGLSHVDSWDYKPELAKRQGTPFDPDGSCSSSRRSRARVRAVGGLSGSRDSAVAG